MMQIFFDILLNFFSIPNHLQKKPPKTNWMACSKFIFTMSFLAVIKSWEKLF